ncbi:SET domain-containing protein 3 [Microbotryomycetes sp. JL201]|nr:SET domain-containing protein 3 [Microbotryomycetes sp. JL201]
MSSALDMLSAAALSAHSRDDAAQGASQDHLMQEDEPVARADAVIEPHEPSHDGPPAPAAGHGAVPAQAEVPLGEADWARIQQALQAELDADKTDEDEPMPDATAQGDGDASQTTLQQPVHQPTHVQQPIQPSIPQPPPAQHYQSQHQRAQFSQTLNPFAPMLKPAQSPPLQLFTDSSGAATLGISSPSHLRQQTIQKGVLPPLASFARLPSIPAPAVSHPVGYVPPYAVPEDSGIIRCVCPYTADDGFTIQCETCNVWQHAACVGILPEHVPEVYSCERCDPQGARERRVDPVKAEQGMRRRMELERLANLAASTAPPITAPLVVEDNTNRTDSDADDDSAAEGPSYRPQTNRRKSVSKPLQLPMQLPPLPGIPSTVAASEDSTSPRHLSQSRELTPGGTPKDSIGRRRRAHKQAGAGRSRVLSASGAPATVSTPAADLVALVNASTDSAAEATPRLSALGGLRSSNASSQHTSNQRASDDEDFVQTDDKYNPWQYEFTPSDRNLYRDEDLVHKLARVLERLEGRVKRAQSDSEVAEEQAEDELRQLRAQTRPLLGGNANDAIVQEVYDDPPLIVMPHLPPSLPVSVKPLPSLAFFLNAPGSALYLQSSTQAPAPPYPRATVHALYAGQFIPANSFIAPVVGQVFPLENFVNDPINQHAAIGTQKQGVHFVPHPFSIAVDGRKFGNEVRFARSGCHPNAVIKVVRVTGSARSKESKAKDGLPWFDQRQAEDLNSKLVFALFSTVGIEKRDEIVLPWCWDDRHVVHALPSLLSGPQLPTEFDWSSLEPLASKMAHVAADLVTTNHCACDRKRDCALFWLARIGSTGLPLTKAQLARGDTFQSLLMNALNLGSNPSGTSQQDGKGKARKFKKPDLGPLLGLYRGWQLCDGRVNAAKPERPVAPEDRPKEEIKAMFPNGPLPVPVAVFLARPKTKTDVPTPVDSPGSQSSVSTPAALGLPRASPSKRQEPIIDFYSDDSDLTEPLTDLSSDSERDDAETRMATVRAQEVVKSAQAKQEKPKTAQRKRTAQKAEKVKTSRTKDVGPSAVLKKKKMMTSRDAVENVKAKLQGKLSGLKRTQVSREYDDSSSDEDGGPKQKQKASDRDSAGGKSRETSVRPIDSERNKVSPKSAKNKERPTMSTEGKNKRSSLPDIPKKGKEGLKMKKRLQPRSPSPDIRETTPMAKRRKSDAADTSRPLAEFDPSLYPLPPPPPPPPMSAAAFAAQFAPTSIAQPSSSLTSVATSTPAASSQTLLAPTVDIGQALVSPVAAPPPRETTPPPPRPPSPPRARLSFAAYRQRLASKPSDEGASPSDQRKTPRSATIALADEVEAGTPPWPPSALPQPQTTTTEPEAVSSSKTSAQTSPAQAAAGSKSAQDVLKKLGDYFGTASESNPGSTAQSAKASLAVTTPSAPGDGSETLDGRRPSTSHDLAEPARRSLPEILPDTPASSLPSIPPPSAASAMPPAIPTGPRAGADPPRGPRADTRFGAPRGPSSNLYAASPPFPSSNTLAPSPVKNSPPLRLTPLAAGGKTFDLQDVPTGPKAMVRLGQKRVDHDAKRR